MRLTPLDMAESYFVGDAAGRKRDFACSDRQCAANIGIAFYTPEEYFLSQPAVPFSWGDFVPRAIPRADAAAAVPQAAQARELVITVGLPASGKSTFATRLSSHIRINQDTLKTRERCVAAAARALDEGHSVVVDNTNADISTRKVWIDLAREHGVPIRCFVFTASIELARHNNLVRALSGLPSLEKRERLPDLAFYSFRKRYVAPTVAEGLAAVETVDFTFVGADDEWQQWSKWWL